MYVQGAVLGVKGDRQEDYLQMARLMGEMFIEYGALALTPTGGGCADAIQSWCAAITPIAMAAIAVLKRG